MALSIRKTKATQRLESDIGRTITEFNALLDELRVWAVRLDAETLADSDYASRLDAAVQKIGNGAGTAFSSSNY